MDESTYHSIKIQDARHMGSNQHHSQVTLITIPLLFREFSRGSTQAPRGRAQHVPQARPALLLN